MSRTPRLRRHCGGSGCVRLSGKDHYLGPWPDKDGPAPPDVQRRYHELVARWVANGRRPLPARAGERGLIVADLADLFVKEAAADYPAGSREPKQYELAFRPLKLLHGLSPAAAFDAAGLELVRDEMVRLGWVRSHVNRSVNRVKRLFRWAGRKKHCPPAVYHDLLTVEPLRRGQRGVGERTRRRPAEEEDVAAVAAHLSGPMSAMLWLLWHTGMRPGEVRSLRGSEVDRSGDVWVYRPADHKRAWKDQPRAVAVGPRGQLVLAPWLSLAGPGPVFDPAALRDRYLAACRVRPAGEEPPELDRWVLSWWPRLPGRLARAGGGSGRYTHDGFEASVRRAAHDAGRPWFSSYCCRHGARMRVGRAAGDEAARAVLGQQTIDTLRHYGLLDEELAKNVMRKIG